MRGRARILTRSFWVNGPNGRNRNAARGANARASGS